MDDFVPTPRTQVGRLPKRAVYDRAQVHAILDASHVCHVGFAVEGQPYVIPTGYVRVGGEIYIHGSPASRLLRTLASGAEVCVSVAVLDGFVLARSAFHHSVNYRSVVIFGKARTVTDPAAKLAALRAFTEHVLAGRWAEVRPPDERELNATAVMALPLDEVSAKVRTGPPIDDEADYSLPVWAGVVPIRQSAGEPVPDSRLVPGVPAIDPGRFTLDPSAVRPKS
jgi:nitroimidazol reductase NimA-like FMN-containing flavoprotein (pyridoxamine 5'-phosphate oxidase superfamily)